MRFLLSTLDSHRDLRLSTLPFFFFFSLLSLSLSHTHTVTPCVVAPNDVDGDGGA